MRGENDMSVKIIQGNLLDAFDRGGLDAIAHCTNCQGVMGSGIALQIKQRYPQVFEDYRSFYEERSFDKQGLILGTASFTALEEGLVCNLHAQQNYGQGKQINYGALADALGDFSLELEYGDVVGVPYLMGSDRAGGDWNVVKEVVDYYLGQDYELRYYKL